ncbi:MAG: ATP-binding protein [Sporichthya sp.]|nr:ATP-binding protein [Sporichthya sp.]
MYRPRVVDQELTEALRANGAVLIEGPRGCGKTATARQTAASEVLLDVDADARQAAALDPGLILDGAAPRLLDEWQIVPAVWNHVRRAVDDAPSPGRFILTGSAVPSDDLTRHTGALRIGRLRMRPMSLFEQGASTGAISLAALLAGDPARSPDTGLSIPDLARRVAIGGWPALLERSADQALRALRGYLDDVARVDLTRVDGVARDPDRVSRLLRSLARNVATPVAAATLAADTGGAEGALKDETVAGYLAALARLLIVEDQPAWVPHLRSRSVLRLGAKRHFVDPSLAVAALRATPELLLRDLNLLGLLFESLVVRDLRVYSQSVDARVLHYRDNTGLEVDAIVERADGAWAAFEIKLGPVLIEDGAASLLRFARRVDTTKTGPPALLGVIVGTGFGYVRPDGVAVIPIGALGP